MTRPLDSPLCRPFSAVFTVVTLTPLTKKQFRTLSWSLRTHHAVRLPLPFPSFASLRLHTHPRDKLTTRPPEIRATSLPPPLVLCLQRCRDLTPLANDTRGVSLRFIAPPNVPLFFDPPPYASSCSRFRASGRPAGNLRGILGPLYFAATR